LKILKSLRKHFIYAAVNQRFQPFEFRWFRSLRQYRDSFSIRKLSSIETLCSKDDNFCMAVLSILWVSRDINLPPDVDVKSITDPPLKDPSAMIDNLNDAFDDLGIPKDPSS
jgi:hypothetical protein